MWFLSSSGSRARVTSSGSSTTGWTDFCPAIRSCRDVKHKPPTPQSPQTGTDEKSRHVVEQPCIHTDHLSERHGGRCGYSDAAAAIATLEFAALLSRRKRLGNDSETGGRTESGEISCPSKDWDGGIPVCMYVCPYVCLHVFAARRRRGMCSRLASCPFASFFAFALCSAQPGCSPLTHALLGLYPAPGYAQRCSAFPPFFFCLPPINSSFRSSPFFCRPRSTVRRGKKKFPAIATYSRHSAFLAVVEWERLHSKSRTKGERYLSRCASRAQKNPRCSRSVPTQYLP